MTACPECAYYGDPCPRHVCPCVADVEGVTISPCCDEHGHLIDEEPREEVAA